MVNRQRRSMYTPSATTTTTRARRFKRTHNSGDRSARVVRLCMLQRLALSMAGLAGCGAAKTAQGAPVAVRAEAPRTFVRRLKMALAAGPPPQCTALGGLWWEGRERRQGTRRTTALRATDASCLRGGGRASCRLPEPPAVVDRTRACTCSRWTPPFPGHVVSGWQELDGARQHDHAEPPQEWLSCGRRRRRRRRRSKRRRVQEDVRRRSVMTGAVLERVSQP